MKKKKQQRKRGIAEEIQVSILSKVVIVFVIVAAVVTFMVGNISLSAQKNDLEMQSKAAAYQLEIFFEEYTTVAEQMALNTDVQTLLEETGPGANITESERYATVFNSMKKTVAATVTTFRQSGSAILMPMLRHSQTAIPVAVISRSQSVHGIRQ